MEDNDGNNMKDAGQQGQENREEGPQEPKERPSYATVTKRNVLPVELSEADKEMVEKFTSRMAEFMPWNRPKEKMVALYFQSGHTKN